VLINDVPFSLTETYHTDLTHSTPYRIAKDEAKGHLVRSTSDLCNTLIADQSLSAEILGELGLSRRDRRPTPVPIISIVGVGQGLMLLECRDPEIRGKRKPKGIGQVQVMVAVAPAGQPAPDRLDRRAWRQLALSGKTDLTVEQPKRAIDETVWLSACWISTRSQFGPLSTPITSAELEGTVTPGAVRVTETAASPMKIAA